MDVPIIAGFAAGLIHVLSGPDHLAAVAPFSAGRPSVAWRVGFRWGLGHSVGVVCVGLAALLLKSSVSLDVPSAIGERMVGIVLVAIGCWTFRKAGRIHTHTHAHGAASHAHPHLHLVGDLPNHRHSHAAFCIGTLHGVAGGAHFLGVLPALAFARLMDGCFYLASFGIGTVVSMMLFSRSVAFVAARVSLASPGGYRNFLRACSGLAVLTGFYWLVS